MVFLTLITKEVMDDITRNAKIENHQFSYAGRQSTHNNKAGTCPSGKRTVYLRRKTNTCFWIQTTDYQQKEKNWQTFQYQHINQAALK